MGGYHKTELLLTSQSDAAVQAANRISPWVEAGLRVWPSTNILHFDASLDRVGLPLDVVSEPRFDDVVQRIDPEIRENVDLHPEKMSRVHALAELTVQKWVYWFHCGDHGLLYEYCYGVDPDSAEPFFHLNDGWVGNRVDATSSLTMAIQFIGGAPKYRHEGEWLARLRELPWTHPK